MVKYWFSRQPDMKLIQVISQCRQAMFAVLMWKAFELAAEMRIDVEAVV